MLEVKNARIEGTSLGFEHHDILTCWLHLDYGGSGQGFGGYVLDTYDKEAKQRVGTPYGTEFILRVLRVVGVRKWEDLVGKHVRVSTSRDKGITCIGHIIKDKWFSPRELAAEMWPKDEAVDECDQNS